MGNALVVGIISRLRDPIETSFGKGQTLIRRETTSQNVIYSRQRSRCMAVFFAFRNPNPFTMTTCGKATSIFNGCRTDGKSKKVIGLFSRLRAAPPKTARRNTGLGQIETLDYQEQGRDTLITANFEVQAIQSSTDLRADWW